MLDIDDIYRAAATIKGVADNMPLVPSPFMTEKSGQDFLLKLENMQATGAFKLRGAYNALSNLPEGVTGVMACSTGNHGRAIAYSAQKLGIKAVITLSRLVPQTKINGIKRLGAEVRILGDTMDEAEAETHGICAKEGLHYVSPFDDPWVIAGQGTIGLELLQERPDLKTLLLPLSGGGLAAGVAVAAKALNPDIHIVGFTMDRGAAMHQSIRAGHVVDVMELPSLADALGGGIGQDNRYTFELCRRYLDETILITEQEIYQALQTLYYEDNIVAEGSCVLGIAGVLRQKITPKEGAIATIITGRNIDMSLHANIMQGRDVQLGDITVSGTKFSHV